MIGTKLPGKWNLGKEGVVIPSFRSIGLERKGCLKETLTNKICKIMNRSNKNGSVIISWDINITRTYTDGQKNELHVDGKLSMEVREYREFIRETVASAVKGIADGIDKEEDE